MNDQVQQQDKYFIPAKARRISPKRTLVHTPRISLCWAALAAAISMALMI
jgi:hypothetical protein